MDNSLSEIASKSLGDSTSYAIFTEHFDSSLLNPMPRSLARDQHKIDMSFVGYDVWHCHEATFLLSNGMPVAGTLKFKYDCQSELMIESKSMKLYLNTFDMCIMGDNLESASRNYELQIKSDLEKCLGTNIDIRFFDSIEYANTQKFNLLSEYKDVAIVVNSEIVISDYSNQYNHVETNVSGYNKLFTNVLRSRCRHTKQKDTGLAALSQQSKLYNEYITADSFLKEVVSLREVNEFHEFCAEKLYSTIKNKTSANYEFCIMLLYSRRGSLDINPVRASSYDMLPQALIDVNVLTEKVQGQ